MFGRCDAGGVPEFASGLGPQFEHLAAQSRDGIGTRYADTPGNRGKRSVEANLRLERQFARFGWPRGFTDGRLEPAISSGRKQFYGDGHSGQRSIAGQHELDREPACICQPDAVYVGYWQRVGIVFECTSGKRNRAAPGLWLARTILIPSAAPRQQRADNAPAHLEDAG